MTHEPPKAKKASVRRQRSIAGIHYNLRPVRAEDMAKPLLMSPGELQAFTLQVAGHRSSDNKKFTGLLQCSGTVLKPILKESQKREVDFYSHLMKTNVRDLIELKAFVPRYYGCQKFTYKGFEQDYIILEDLTQRMLEQCVMDVKIGKRTWDPLATEDKIKREQEKYARCKQQYSFCIPGYQVYKLATGKLLKYGKDHGKKLHGRMVREAIRNYLNGIGARLCRALILQFLSELWKLQAWARRQRAVRLYCTSLLLVYDAARLRDCCGTPNTLTGTHEVVHPVPGRRTEAKCRPVPPVTRRRSVPAVSFSRTRTAAPAPPPPPPPPPVHSPWTEALDNFTTNHAFDHNYEDKLSRARVTYRATLDQLSCDAPNPNPWGTVKIIDFAHAFFNEGEGEGEVDENFKEGVDSLVQIFEDLLHETGGQG